MLRVASMAVAVFALLWGACGGHAAQAQTAEISIEIQLVAAQARIQEVLPVSAQVQQQFGRINQGLAKQSADGKLTAAEVRAEVSSAKAIAAQGMATLNAMPPLRGDASITLQTNAFMDAIRGSTREISDLLDQGQVMWEARLRGDDQAAARAQARLQLGVVAMSRNAALAMRANKMFVSEDDAVWDLMEGGALLSDGMTAMVSARFGQTPAKTAANDLRATEAALREAVARGGAKLEAEAKRDAPDSLDLKVEGTVFRALSDVAPMLLQIARRLDTGDTSTLKDDMHALRDRSNEIKAFDVQARRRLIRRLTAP